MADDFAPLLDAELSAGLAQFDPDVPVAPTMGFVVPGLDRTQSLSELAELLSGTSDKKSRAYKSARRQAERWSPSERARARGIKARTPTVRARERLGRARRQQNTYLRQLRLHGGSMKIFVKWASGDTKGRWKPPAYWVHIRQQVMREVLRDWADGRNARAERTLFAEFLEQYEVPNPDDWFQGAEVQQLRLVPPGAEDM